MEDEARDILRSALSTAWSRGSLVKSIRRRIEPLGRTGLGVVAGAPMREPLKFEE
jgi:plasmid stability protein